MPPSARSRTPPMRPLSLCGPGASLLVNVPAAIALERAYLAELRGDTDGMATFASQALAGLGDGERMLDSVTRLHGPAPTGCTAGAGGRTRLVAANRPMAGGGPADLSLRGFYLLGQVQRAQATLDAAARTYRQVVEIGTPPGRPALPSAGA